MKTIYSKTQIPIYNALGPFPDETILSSIDRALFLIGGKRIQKFFNSESCCSRCSLENEKNQKIFAKNGCGDCHVKQSPTCSMVQDSTHSTPDIVNSSKCIKPMDSEIEDSKHSKYDEVNSSKYIKVIDSAIEDSKYSTGDEVNSNNRPQVTIKDNSCREESAKLGIPMRTLRRSFSLCSLACGKLKEKLTFAQTRSVTKSDDPPKWLWTKMEIYADGSQVYEVFKNSSAASHPTKFDTSQASKIILVILPTGVIMPFETLPRH